MTTTEKLLWELVALPSVNPAYVPAGGPYGGEQRVAEYLAGCARKAGLDVELRTVLPGRPNVWVKLSPLGKARQRILLAPHLDTVGGAELPGKLFQPQLRGSRLYGRGACDTKASVAVMLSALAELAGSGGRPAQTEIIFVGLIDEECGQAGSRAVAKSGFKADLAMVGEPTRLQVVTAHKGVLWLELKAQGKAAHASHPELGVNAVHLMARIVEALETGYARRLRRRKHPLLGHGTINVGAICGGSQPNIVPGECTSLVDFRMLPGETEGQVMGEIRAFLGAAVRAIQTPKPDSQSKVRPAGILSSLKMAKWQTGPCPALETDPKLPLVQNFLKCAGQKAAAGAQFFSDAGVLSGAGIPSIVFGPGNIAQAHKLVEWIGLKQLEAGWQLLLQYLRSLS